MKTVKIDVTKIEKARLFKGEKGTYLDLVLHERPDDFGNDGFVTQSCSKEERDKGVKMPIIGNWRRIQPKAKPAAQKQGPTPQGKPGPTPVQEKFKAELPPGAEEDDDVPF